MMYPDASMLSKKGKAGKGENIGRKEGLASEHAIRIKTQSRTVGAARMGAVVKKKNRMCELKVLEAEQILVITNLG